MQHPPASASADQPAAAGHSRARPVAASAGRLLLAAVADFGADVLKVEDTGMGDYIRWSPPYYEGAHESARSAMFFALNRNKRSIRLDLKQERGREALLALVREHDVVPSPFAPACSIAWGWAMSACARRTRVGLLRAGYGQDRPQTRGSGHDMNYLGLSACSG